MEYLQLSMDDYIQAKTEIRKELGGIRAGICSDWMEINPDR